MKMIGRKHRPCFRICATDSRAPRDGRVIEELGTYDPSIADTDARTQMNAERIAYWLSVGAQPSDRVSVLWKKYGPEGTHRQQHEAAVAKLALPKQVPDPGPPTFVLKPKKAAKAEDAAPAPAAAAPAGPVEAAAATAETAAAPAEPAPPAAEAAS